jgi:hypothetical protein
MSYKIHKYHIQVTKENVNFLNEDTLDATLCDKVCQLRAAGQWFSPGTPLFSINKTDRHDIAEIL